jgi:hypothetical protein
MQQLENGGEDAVANLLSMMWNSEGIGEYTIDHLQETLRQLGVE